MASIYLNPLKFLQPYHIKQMFYLYTININTISKKW